MSQHKQLFTIQQVSFKLDLPKSTLRFWEKEFDGLITPARTNGGQRRYSYEHISILKKIKELREVGVSIEEVKRILIGSDDSDLNHSRPGDIDRFIYRISEIVKYEIHNFLNDKREKGSHGN